MYWYLSFLRPPPVSTPISSGSITITPQIANDLRTEQVINHSTIALLSFNPDRLLFDRRDISYSWQRISPSIDQPIAGPEILTWNPPESTYKPISIPLPLSAKPGESWRIGLHIGALSTPLLIQYVDDKPGIIPVWSEGISLVRGEPSTALNGNGGKVRGVGAESHKSKKGDSKGKGKATSGGSSVSEEGKKQGRIVREWKLGLKDDQGSLKIVEQTSFDLDKKIWDSGLALSGWFWKYLNTDHHNAKARRIIKLLQGKEDLKVVEIGSGTGLVSIALDLALRRTTSERSVEITATDLESAIELMDENLALNSSATSDTRSVRAKVLDWEQDLPSWVDGPWPDLIIAADVTYNTASFPCLHSTLVNLLKPASGDRPPLILAYKQRDIAERELWGLLGNSGISMDKVDEIQGSEEEGVVEIWVGKAT